MKQCLSCGKVLADDANVCSNCGKSLVKNFAYICNHCGQRITKPAKQCYRCGTAVTVVMSANTVQSHLTTTYSEKGKEMLASAASIANEGLAKATEKFDAMQPQLNETKEKAAVAVDNLANRLSDGLKIAKEQLEAGKERAQSVSQEAKKSLDSITATASNTVTSMSEKAAENSVADSKINMPIVAGALVVGMLLGVGFGFASSDTKNVEKFNVSSLTSEVQYFPVYATIEGCKVSATTAELRDTPSALNGKVLETLGMLKAVKYIDTVSSQDTNSKEGYTKKFMQLHKIFKSYDIPVGTRFTITGYDSYENGYIARMPVEGKMRSVVITDLNDVQLGYTGNWRKVEYNNKVGYVQSNLLTEKMLISEEEF